MEKHIHRKSSKDVKILVVEDDVINQILFINLLQKKGWHPYVAREGQEALKILELQTFDIILMDIVMPHMDGFETTSRIREIEKKTGTRIPIIATTATEDKEKCILSGMDDYISKPINIKKFYRIIQKFL